ncbi:MAG: two-component sensor histidine kinase, partial [Cyanobacteria bacterium J083]
MVVNTNNFLIMAFGESSFRRILLSRLLCLSVPFLIFGIYVTYRKARSAFLDTARQNLTESSVRKGESINQAIEAIRGNLATASSIANLKTKSKANHQLFVQQLHHALPMGVECVQIQDVRTQEITGGTCRSQLTNLSENDFPLTQSFKENLTPLEEVKVKFISPVESNQNSVRLYPKNSLNLLFYAPIYNAQGYLQYKLLVQLTLIKNEKVEPGSLDGYSVVINEDGVILAHPIAQRIGKNIRDMPDATRLESILRNAVEGKENFLHLFSFEKNDVELVAGYTAIPSPITGEEGKKWVILAVSRLDLALLPLKTIQHLLTSLAFVLIIVNILAILY